MADRLVVGLSDAGLSRRQFLRASAFGVAVLWGGGALARATAPDASHMPAGGDRILRSVDVAYFTALLPAVIVQAKSEQDVAGFVDSFERMLAPAAENTLASIRDLVDLLTGSLTRPLVTFSLSDWSEMSVDEISGVLESWRDSSLEIKRIAYGLTTSLIRTAWYMQPEAQVITGYPGAPKKVVGREGVV